jgi:hypothetical protein
MKYLAQPLYQSSPAVQIYELPINSPIDLALPTELDANGADVQGWLGNPNVLYAHSHPGVTNGGANGALVFQNPATGDNCIFVVYSFNFASDDFSVSISTGVVCVYNLSSLVPVLSPGAMPNAYILLPNGPIGIALQPGSGDLYIATDSGGFSPGPNGGGVYMVPKPVAGWNSLASSASAPTNPTQILDQNSQGSLQVCSNLAFDLHGNLWMTVIGPFSGATPGNGLVCLQIPGNSAPYPALFFTDTPATDPSVTSPTLDPTLPSASLTGAGATPLLYAFSAPEGLAFDPDGNLWIANNNEDYEDDVNPKVGGYYGSGGGSLLMLSSAWLFNNLYPLPNPAASSTAGGLPITAGLVAAGDAFAYWHNANAQFGGIAFDGHTMYLNDEGAGVVWSSTVKNGVVSNFQASGVTTTNPGNGSMAIFSEPYPAGNLALTVRDTSTDVGAQPDTSAGSAAATGILWESPDILIGNQPDSIVSYPAGSNFTAPAPVGTAGPAPSSSGVVETGKPAYINVRVSNFGSAPSSGAEILKLYYGFASTGLSWPAPWDGSAFYNGVLPLGNIIGETQLPVIPAESEIYAQIGWPASQIPDPSNYLQAAGANVVQSGHFCLLARIETNSLYPFGMFTPEEFGDISSATALHDNVYNNAAMGWRNIAIVDVTGGETFGPDYKLHVLGANYGSRDNLVTFGVQTLGKSGKVERINARIIVHAEGAALRWLLDSELEEHRLRCVGPRDEGRFELLDRAGGMSKIPLPANEVLPFTLHFTPEEGIRDFAVQITQYVHVDGVQKVFGGQTFVVGEVEGFPIRAR